MSLKLGLYEENLTKGLHTKAWWGVRKPHGIGQYPEVNIRGEQVPPPRPEGVM